MADFDFGKYKVLLCDPAPEDIEIVRDTYLEQGVMDFVATPSPEEALRQIPKMKPDLILVALDFEGMSGIQVIQKIRALNDGEFYTTPILMLLNKVSQNLLREACRAGIEGAIRKPVQKGKVLRFSRAVILKPRRFICVRHYFGPERRQRDDPHYNGDDRRSSFRPEELTTDEFTKPRRSSGPAFSVSDSDPLGGVRSGGGSSSSNSDPDWGQSQTRAGAEGEMMNLGGSGLRGADNQGTTMNMGSSSAGAGGMGSMEASGGLRGGSGGDIEVAGTGKGNGGDIELAGGGATGGSSGSSADYDFTPEDRPSQNGDFDYGTSKDRKSDEAGDIGLSKEKKKKKTKPESEAAADKEKKPEKVEAKAPEPEAEEEYEEIIDLEECLDLHKEWINSGGKLGQRANRPNSDFRGKELEDADFTQAALPKSNFAEVNCTNTVFRKADLRGSTFRKAKLSSADLRVTLLRKADMRNARMDKANLLGADLSGANLEGATLRGVNMSGANLNRTNLRGVNLVSVQGLIPEQIKRAITDKTTRLPFNT